MSFLQRVTRYGKWYLKKGEHGSDKIQSMRGQALVLVLHANPVLISCGLILAHDPSLPFLLALGPVISLFGLWGLKVTGKVGLIATTHVFAMQLLACAIIFTSKTFVSFHYVLVPYNVIITSLIAGSSQALGIAVASVSLVLGTLFYNLSIGTHLPFSLTMLDYAFGSFATIVGACFIVAFLTKRFEELRVQKEQMAIKNQSSLNQSLNVICLGNLVGNINHEFNNALGIIRASLEYIERSRSPEGDKEKRRRSVQLVDNGLERINFILNGLRLSVAFDEVLEADRSLVSTICAKTIIYTEPCLKQYHQQLKFADYTANALIVFPSQILLKVLESLIINACEAANSAGVITIAITRRAEWIDFEVIDSGHGILPNVAEHIFEPFYSTKQKGVGKGLGLSIARRLMESQRGSLQYLADREATTFVASVPLGRL